MIVTDHGKPVLEVRRYESSALTPLEALRGSGSCWTLTGFFGGWAGAHLASRPVLQLRTNLAKRETSSFRPSVRGEVALLARRGKIRLSMDVSDWMEKVGRIEAVRFLPVDSSIAIKSMELPGQFHNDPVDRLIVATARALSAPLVTKDKLIRKYEYVKTIW